MANIYRIINGGRVIQTTLLEHGAEGVDIMANYKEYPYEVVPSFTLSPLTAVNYINTNFLTVKADAETGVSEDETKNIGDAKTIVIPITNQFNDYPYETTVSMLDSVFEFKAITELIFTIAYDYCELRKDESVEGIELSGDSSGFLFKSRYFNSTNKFDNYRTLLGLVTERFITLKRQYYMWDYSALAVNSIDQSNYNFFIFPSV